jgi:ribosomal protein L29
MAEDKKTEQPGTPEAAGNKNKKINEMTIKDLEAKLAEVKEKQGGLTSKYAQQLLLRKKSLTS